MDPTSNSGRSDDVGRAGINRISSPLVMFGLIFIVLKLIVAGLIVAAVSTGSSSAERVFWKTFEDLDVPRRMSKSGARLRDGSSWSSRVDEIGSWKRLPSRVFWPQQPSLWSPRARSWRKKKSSSCSDETSSREADPKSRCLSLLMCWDWMTVPTCSRFRAIT